MNVDWTSVDDEPLMEDRGVTTVEVPASQMSGEKVHVLCPVCGTRLRDVGRTDVTRGNVVVCPNRLCRQVVRLKSIRLADA